MGVRWLNRKCSTVLYELAGAGTETPDVIGWAGQGDSILIECKLTRSDFLRDAQKPARRDPRAGMGKRRYYLCPLEVIQLKDLPPKWGLLWIERNQVTVKREARGHPERNLRAEVESSVACCDVPRSASGSARFPNGCAAKTASKPSAASPRITPNPASRS